MGFIKGVVKNQKGFLLIELLFIVPILVMIVSFIIEIGFIMYDMALLNYTASTMAVEAARKGCFDQDIYSRARQGIMQYISEDMPVVRSTEPVEAEGSIVVWGPSDTQKFQRGEIISVGIIKPVKFRLLYLDRIAHWVIEEKKFFLRARASAESEVYFP